MFKENLEMRSLKEGHIVQWEVGEETKNLFGLFPRVKLVYELFEVKAVRNNMTPTLVIEVDLMNTNTNITKTVKVAPSRKIRAYTREEL